MQAASACFTGSLPIRGTKTLVPRRSFKPQKTLILYPKAVASNSASETSMIDYSSANSVFPAEACEIIGGDACNGQMFPEAQLAASARSGGATAAPEEVDREYFEYNLQKTVFPGAACDDLGGEFCNAEYQTGVYQELAK